MKGEGKKKSSFYAVAYTVVGLLSFIAFGILVGTDYPTEVRPTLWALTLFPLAWAMRWIPERKKFVLTLLLPFILLAVIALEVMLWKGLSYSFLLIKQTISSWSLFSSRFEMHWQFFAKWLLYFYILILVFVILPKICLWGVYKWHSRESKSS